MEPYCAVIFSSTRRVPASPHGDGDDGYDATADRMEALAALQPGYRGIESARGTDGFGITVSYWTDETSAQAWKRNAEHLEAQRLGREQWYASWVIRVAAVTREYTSGTSTGDRCIDG